MSETPDKFHDQPAEGGRAEIDHELARQSAGEGKAPAKPPKPEDENRRKDAIDRTAGLP